MNLPSKQLGFWGAALSGGISLLGGMLSNKGASNRNKSQIASAKDTNKFNAEQAALNRGFQQDMSNTAHQREVSDLRSAGLNPILSATGGSGASTASGSTASGVMPNIEDQISPGISKALEIRKNIADVKYAESQAKHAEAQASKAGAETKGIVYQQMERIDAELDKIVSERGKIDNESLKIRMDKILSELSGHEKELAVEELEFRLKYLRTPEGQRAIKKQIETKGGSYNSTIISIQDHLGAAIESLKKSLIDSGVIGRHPVGIDWSNKGEE